MGVTYPNEIYRILRMPGGDVGKACRALALDIAAEAKRIATNELGKNPADKPRTGAMARSYRVEVVPGTNQFVVKNNKSYAAAIELGAKPHEIRARRVEYLHFRDRQGRTRRVKLVRHPGNPAFNILTRAAMNATVRRYGTAKRS